MHQVTSRALLVSRTPIAVQRLRIASDDPLAHVPCNFVMHLSQAQAGAVLGLKGSNIIAINKALVGAKVSIQGRNEVEEGDLRALTITGQMNGVSAALNMVVNKLRDSGRQPRGPPRQRTSAPAPAPSLA
jgi:KH domain